MIDHWPDTVPETANQDARGACRRLLDDLLDGQLTADEQGCVTWCDTAAERLLGCLPGELVGETLPWLPEPGEPRDVVVLESSQRARVIAARAVPDGAGRRVGLRDLTTERQRDAELRRAEAHYRGIFENCGEGIFRSTPNGELLLANPALARLLGYESPGDLMARVSAEGPDIYMEPLVREGAIAELLRRDRVTALEIPVRRADGSSAWASITAQVVRDNNGDVLYIEGSVEDITRRRADEAALAFRMRLEQVVAEVSTRFVNVPSSGLAPAMSESLAAVAQLVGAEFGVAYLQPEDGGTPRAVAGWHHPDLDRRWPEQVPEPQVAMPWIAAELAAGRLVAIDDLGAPGPMPADALDRRFFSQFLAKSIMVAPLTMQNTVVGAMVLTRRTTPRPWSDDCRLVLRLVAEVVSGALQRRRGEDERFALLGQMQHAQKLESLGVLAGGIAHDFNNLLVGILGHASLAASELGPHHPVSRAIGQVETAARRAAELTNQLLAYSGKGVFLTARFDLNEMVSEMTALLETAVSRKAELALELEPQLPEIEGDPAQIRQVVMNLLTNASDSLGEQTGRIHLRTGVTFANSACLRDAVVADDLEPGDYVFLEVTDTGCGMSAETVARIFDPFFTTKFAGRGLGLAAVLGIVRGHHGTLTVQTAPGSGTTLRVLLPPARTAWRTESATEPETGSLAPGLRLLVVDDDETVREVAAAIAGTGGFDVVQTEDGPSALALIEAGEPFDLVLLDLTMPRMSGTEVLSRLATLRPGLPVVLSSGYSETEVRGRIGSEGLAGFIQKPYPPHALLGVLREALRS
ncbi:MAG: response regulator [Armatimonadetes bacterium]|nr:response regulator [Armatimonadota bacterium]